MVFGIQSTTVVSGLQLGPRKWEPVSDSFLTSQSTRRQSAGTRTRRPVTGELPFVSQVKVLKAPQSPPNFTINSDQVFKCPSLWGSILHSNHNREQPLNCFDVVLIKVTV